MPSQVIGGDPRVAGEHPAVDSRPGQDCDVTRLSGATGMLNTTAAAAAAGNLVGQREVQRHLGVGRQGPVLGQPEHRGHHVGTREHQVSWYKKCRAGGPAVTVQDTQP